MEDMVYHGERLEPTTSPPDRGTHPEGRSFFQSGTVPLTTELLLSSHPRTSQFDQGQPILLPATAHQEHHPVHSQGDGTYTVQRLLRDRTPLSNLPIQLTYRTGDMDRRSSSQDRCHTDLLLVAAQRHRSGSSNNITRLEPDDSYGTDNIPDLTSPENRFSRCLRSSRTLLHLPISSTFPTHMSTPCYEETPGQDAQEISRPVPTTTRHAADTQRIRPHHLAGTIDPSLPRHHPVDRDYHGKTRRGWRSQTEILPTHMPCVRSTVPHQIGLFTRGGPTYWPLALRCYQTLHPRSPIAASTRSQPPGTSTQRDDQPTSPEPRPTRGPSPPTPVLDLQSNDQGLPRTSSSGNMH